MPGKCRIGIFSRFLEKPFFRKREEVVLTVMYGAKTGRFLAQSKEGRFPEA
jgi:hypothetical protein